MRKSAIYFGVGGLLLLLLWVVFHQSQKQAATPRSVDSKNQASNHGTASLPNDPPKDLGKEENKIVLHAPDPVLKAELQALKSLLAQKPDRETALRLLREFMQKAFASNPDAEAAALLEFLQSGQDEATGLDFIVGEAGLDEWPSLRTFLLDLLGKIDLDAAAQYALANIIPFKKSTPEYAVSLQILWNDGGAEKPTPELTQAWLGLLGKADWSARPDAAWLESLDFASRIPEATPVFIEAASLWLARPEEASGKAETVEIALERMMIRHPAETLSALLENSQWMSEGRGPAVRATLFARADASAPEQVIYLKDYLQNLDPSGNEAKVFYRSFPCYNFGVAPGLSGQADIPGGAEIQKRLRADLLLLQGWQRDPSMTSQQAWLGQTVVKIGRILGANH